MQGHASGRAAAAIGATWLLAGAAMAQGATPREADDARACASMQGRSYAGGRVVAATYVRPPHVVRWINSARYAVVQRPFCRLEGYTRPGRRSHAAFEAWLPAPAHWNGRLLGVGAGGSMGDVNLPALADGVNRGFASIATDNGHRSPASRDDHQWAYGEWDRIVDFGYRAHHAATVAGKAAIAVYYGRPARYSYLAGCSQGGQKGLMAAQRHPSDYDGILAGAPVYSWVGAMTQQAWTVHALTATPQSLLRSGHMQALQDAALRQCAGANGLIQDPAACAFDPAAIACPRADGGTCLEPAQVEAARRIYSGPSTAAGLRLHPGFAPGSERGWEQLYGQVNAEGTVGGSNWLGFYRYMALDDPGFTLLGFDFDRHPAAAQRKLAGPLDPDDPDLDAFGRRGGKLLVYHGWADQQVPPAASVEYHDAVVARRPADQARGHYRLFMIPGMAHCVPEFMPGSAEPAAGPNLVPQLDYEPGVPLDARNDALTALVHWVERGRTPGPFVVRVRHEPAGLAARTVLACAHPEVAQYRGTGDPLDAANWECRAHTRKHGSSP